LRLCLGAGAVCLAVWDCDSAQSAAAQASIQQTAAAHHPPVHLTPANGLKKLQSRANRGEAASQFELGVRYAKADGSHLAKQEAVVWYRRAAEQGFAKAQTALGRCYANGEGVAQDYDQATKWYRKAAEQEDADAQCNLGVFYGSGQGVAQDHREAVKWYRKAAEQGNVIAQNNLGVCYVDGQGVAKDYVEGFTWLRKALRQGSEHAQANLALAKAKQDANWHKDVSQGGTSQVVRGPRQKPMPDTPTPQAPRSPTHTTSIAGGPLGGTMIPGNDIRTTDGVTYKSVRILKVEPDALLVEHSLQGRGIGMARLKFENLTSDLQQRYGYDIGKATAYRSEQAAKQGPMRTLMEAQEALFKQEWAYARAKEEDNFRGRKEIDRLENERRQAEAARAQAEAARAQAEAEAARAQAEAASSDYSYWWWYEGSAAVSQPRPKIGHVDIGHVNWPRR
jgi:TPR repeat protein